MYYYYIRSVLFVTPIRPTDVDATILPRITQSEASQVLTVCTLIPLQPELPEAS